jgi:tetratricopeptide (TPR) repeat protein
LAQAKKYDDEKTISYNYGMLGEIFLAKNQIDSALHYFQLGKELKFKLNFDKGIAVSNHLIGQALFAQNDLDSAAVLFNRALQWHREYKNERYQALCLAYLGKIYFAKGKLDSSEIYLTQAKAIAEDKHSIENLVIIEDALFELYRQRGMHSKAYEALKNHYASCDSMRKVKALRNIQSLDVEYHSKQREQEIALLSKDNYINNQRIRVGAVFLIMLALSLVLGVTLYIQRRRNSKMAEANLQHKLSRSQMNPHFVSNAMSSIQSFMYSNSPNEAAKYLGKFANLNRAVLEHSLVDSIPLDDEIAMLSNYLDFERLRLSDAFSYSITVDEDLDTEMLSIPPLFIQPFVENAVKYGVKDMGGKGIITIKFTDYKKYLKVEVLDNGLGVRDENTIEKSDHKSRSTEIVKKRLKLLKGKYKDIPNITIANNGINVEEGVHITIYLPILSC